MADVVARNAISASECELYRSFVANSYIGNGRLVQFGAPLEGWLACVQEGFETNSHKDDVLRLWQKPICAQRAPTLPEDAGLPAAASCPVEWQDGHQLADIWTGDKISLLVLERVVTRQSHLHVLQALFPCLQPGALIAYRDFFVDQFPFVKYAQESMAKYFDLIWQNGPVAAFKLNAELPSDAIFFAKRVPAEQQIDLLQRVKERCRDPWRRFLVELSKIHVVVREHPGSIDETRRALDEVSQKLPRDAPDWVHQAIGRVQHRLQKKDAASS